VKGFVWLDDASGKWPAFKGSHGRYLVRDFLGENLKGSHLRRNATNSRRSLAATYSAYDFDARKFFSSISVHQKTYASHYKRVGHREAIPIVRSELEKLGAITQPAPILILLAWHTYSSWRIKQTGSYTETAGAYCLREAPVCENLAQTPAAICRVRPVGQRSLGSATGGLFTANGSQGTPTPPQQKTAQILPTRRQRKYGRR